MGYPGETRDEFEELRDFVAEVEFDRLGVFTYSHEPGTLAHELEDDIPEQVKYDRRDEIMLLQQGIMLKKNRSQVGKSRKVLIDTYDEQSGEFLGRTEWDSPEVDGLVRIPAPENQATVGEFYTVRIHECNEYELFGRLEEPVSQSGVVKKQSVQTVK
ncbi:MAG: TRAM domain-containing protein [Calditrichota bacterium]